MPMWMEGDIYKSRGAKPSHLADGTFAMILFLELFLLSVQLKAESTLELIS